MSTTNTILVIDLGLTNCKSIVFSDNGVILAESNVGYRTYSPRQGYMEQDPKEWWKAVRQAIKDLWQDKPDLADKIDCISVTGHMHALTCLDKEGQAIGRALVLGDQRSIGAADQITAELGQEKVYRIIGTRMDASLPAAKILWLKKNAPDVFSKTGKFVSCKDFIRTRMADAMLTDPIDACGMALYDLRSRAWSNELLSFVGIHSSQMPTIAQPTQIAGKLKSDASKALGLKAGIPIVVGAGDDIEVLGHGLIEPGQALEHIGTTGSILACCSDIVMDKNMTLEVYPHAMEHLWVYGGSITSAGSAISWASQMLGYPNVEASFSSLDSDLPNELMGSLVFLPHLMGERAPTWTPRARGAWIGLTHNHSRDQIMHSVFFGIANALNHVVECLENVIGELSTIRISARPDNQTQWASLRADVYGRPLALVRTSQPTALGAMILAAVGIGIYCDIPEATRNVTKIKKIVNFFPGRAEYCHHLYARYREAQSALMPYWHDHDAQANHQSDQAQNSPVQD